jgi:hypothetical protein
MSLKPVFYCLSLFVRDEVDLRYRFHHHVSVCVKLYGHRRKSVLRDINESAYCGQVGTVELEYASAVCLSGAVKFQVLLTSAWNK